MLASDYAPILGETPDRAARAIRLAWVCASEGLAEALPLIEAFREDLAALSLARDCAQSCDNFPCFLALESALCRRELASLAAGPLSAGRRL